MASAGLLTGEEIRTLKLITTNEKDDGYRGASYDVHVGSIIVPDHLTQDEAEYEIQPQGVVEVISSERITLPKDIAGYAMVKTSLCDQGILALNIGIIDPFWDGPVSTTLLNFSKQTHVLSKGSVFLRLTFHRCGDVDQKYTPRSPTADEYRATKRGKARDFGPSFLNLEENVKKISTAAFWKFALWGGSIVAVITIVASFTIGLVAMMYSSYEQHAHGNNQIEDVRRGAAVGPAEVDRIVAERLAAERIQTNKDLAASEKRLQDMVAHPATTTAPQPKGR